MCIRDSASGVREWLQNIVNEDEPDETTQKAAELMGRLDPVSYTHLDVYKRQHQGRQLLLHPH